jgi:beta-1,4-mannooligosaccharide/beta-1,4-mannosyl-N-acetylglucosamine phosphorylase
LAGIKKSLLDTYVGLAFTYLDEIVAYIKEHSVVTEMDTEIGIR